MQSGDSAIAAASNDGSETESRDSQDQRPRPPGWRNLLPRWLISLLWVDSVDRYDAFLSYSWKSDTRVAPLIQSVLQQFLRPWYKPRAKAIFRDLSCLPAGSSLEKELYDRLDRSAHFIVLACPNAARSGGMEMEAKYWFSRPRQGQVLIIVTDGEFKTWEDLRRKLLPASVRANLPAKPLWISLHHRRSEILKTPPPSELRGQLIEDLQQVFLRLHEPKNWGQLQGEDRAQRRHALTTVWSAALLFLALALAAIGFARYAQTQRRQADINAAEATNQKGIAIQQRDYAQAERRRAEMNLAEARKQKGIAMQQRDLAQVRQLRAQVALLHTRQSQDPELSSLLAIELLRRSEELDDGSVLREFVGPLPQLVSRFGQRAPSSPMSFSADGQLLVTIGDDRAVHVFEVTSGKEVGRFQKTGSVQAVAMSKDRLYVATGGQDGARILEVHSGRELLHLKSAGQVLAVAFCPSAKCFATGGGDKMARIFDTATGNEVRKLEHPGQVQVLSFSADGKSLATIAADGIGRVFDVSTGTEKVHLPRQRWGVQTLALSPDGQDIVTGNGDNSSHVFDIATGQELCVFGTDGPVESVAFFQDHRYVATVSRAGTVRIFETPAIRREDAREVSRMSILPEEASEFSGGGSVFALSSDGRYVAVTGYAGAIRIFENTDRSSSALLHEQSVGAVAFNPDGTLLTAATSHGADVYETAAVRKQARIPLGGQGGIRAIAVSPDRRQIVIGSDDGTVRMFDAPSGQQSFLLRHRGIVLSAAFSPDGKYIATTGSNDNTARVSQASDGTEVFHTSHIGEVNALAFSPDGRYLATGSQDRFGRVFEVKTGREVWRSLHDDPVLSVAFSPNGQYLATGTDGGYARVFEVPSGKVVSRLGLDSQGTVAVHSLAFSPDGIHLAAGGDDNLVRLFDFKNGNEVTRIAVSKPVEALAYTPDGYQLYSVASSGHDDTEPFLFRHYLHAQNLIDDSCLRLTRNLTQKEWDTYIGKEFPRRKTCANLP